MKSIFVPRSPHDKAMQRALLQYRRPQNRHLVLEALQKCGREDLIGYDRDCLVRPMERAPFQRPEGAYSPRPAAGMDKGNGKAPSRSAGKGPAKKGTAAAAPSRPKPPKPKYSSKWAKAKKK
jgi:hypothetical protein